MIKIENLSDEEIKKQISELHDEQVRREEIRKQEKINQLVKKGEFSTY